MTRLAGQRPWFKSTMYSIAVAMRLKYSIFSRDFNGKWWKPMAKSSPWMWKETSRTCWNRVVKSLGFGRTTTWCAESHWNPQSTSNLNGTCSTRSPSPPSVLVLMLLVCSFFFSFFLIFNSYFFLLLKLNNKYFKL